jgi:hypothetical protein
MKVKWRITAGQFEALSEDLCYLEAADGGGLLQPGTRELLKEITGKIIRKTARRCKEDHDFEKVMKHVEE